MDDEGCLRFTCKFRQSLSMCDVCALTASILAGQGAPDTPATFSAQTARQFLKDSFDGQKMRACESWIFGRKCSLQARPELNSGLAKNLYKSSGWL